jgi:hypothetical protein
MNVFRSMMMLLLMALSFNAFSTVVGSVADSRFGDTWTLDGSQMPTTRAKLLETANFGPAGTIPEAISIIDVAGEIDAAVLADIDVFFIGYLSDDNPNAFTADEISAFQTWVNGGGAIIITCDDSNYDAICEAFGHPSTSQGSSPVVVEGSALTHPLFDGPFGIISTFGSAGTIGYFADANGATILARESSGDFPQIMEESSGSGLVILVGDVDTMSDFGGYLSAGTGISTDNDIWLGNLFAYASSSSVVINSNNAAYVPVPTIGSFAMAVMLLLLLLTGMFATRRFDRN